MDMDSSHPNWLVFSLSNHSSLFQPSFTQNPTSSSSDVDHQQDNGSGAVLCGPKLEDFLGSSGGAPVAQFDGGVSLPEMEMYDDSELKTIAASFLRGFSADNNPHKQTAPAPPPPQPEPPAKKAVETFGQRTSIFRGVTR